MTCRLPEGPIPWDKVALYAEKKGLESDVADLLWSVIRTMDLEERRWVSENTMTPNPDGGEPSGDA